MVIIKCDFCGQIANEKYSAANITVERGSNISIGGGINCKHYDACEGCFGKVINYLEQALKEGE